MSAQNKASTYWSINILPLTPDYPLQQDQTEKDRIKEILTRDVHALRDECELVPATLAHLSG